ncbi:hypothetical protein [Maribacter sp. 2307UL18-2]|uniref:hypothetical protein n=1 Tax=Maribacter sp. 2307UL18-2 TaxID=3386274 RepID=UPI0039BC4E35
MHRLISIQLIGVIALLFMACSSDNTEDPSVTTSELTSKLGIWEGTGTQPGFSWTIKITLTEAEQLIEYPSLECGGFLTLLEETDASLLFRETITFNTVCADQGFIELLEISADEMKYNYYFPNASNEKGDLGATGTVKKTK